MNYKPEIDGLRAIAVVLVLLSHVQLGITGGFIGVDVFFVISGFLITSIIVSGVEQKRFRFVPFYAKRFVRLYPALIVVVALTFLASFVLSDPEHLATTARSGKYALASISNIYFSKNLGYFDALAIQQPFLHTWTLGVEWQFYLLAPLFVWLLMKHSKEALIIGLSIVVGASVVLSQAEIGVNAKDAYYLMPYRAFELGIGCLLVFVYHKKCSSPVSVLLTFTGLAMIITASIIFAPQTPFPGYAALLPTLGTALCIYGAQGFVKGNILLLKPMIGIGKISYSAYLVHWPLIVFWQYVLVFRDMTFYDRLALFVLSLLFGYIIYKLVESKITWKKLKHKVLGCVAIFMAGLVLVVGANWVLKHPKNLEWRVSSPNEEKYYHVPYEIFGNSNNKYYATFIADSMGFNYAAGLDDILQSSPYYMNAFYAGGCYMIEPYYMFNTQNSTHKQNCINKNMAAFDFVKTNPSPVILAQAWEGKTDLIEINSNNKLSFSNNIDDAYKEFLRERLSVLRQLLGNRKLILIGSPPYKLTEYEGREYLRPSCANRPDFLIDLCKNFSGESYKVEESFVWEFNEIIRKFAETHPNTYYIDPSPVICPERICNTRRNDEFYRANDMNHFTPNGSRRVAPYIWSELEKVLK